MPETIPSMYSVTELGGGHRGGVLEGSNVKLRFGEVKREILPSDPKSYSKKYREYDVMVQHYENGGAAHKMYYHCMVLNQLCGLGDYSTQTLRVSDKADYQLGNGSRVYILFTEGNDSRGVIIGGPQQHKDTSSKVHKEIEYNGVNLQINDDGGWVVVAKGATDKGGVVDGRWDKEGGGTKVEVLANGNFLVTSGNGKCSLSIDNKGGEITINSSDKFVIKTNQANVEADSIDMKASSTSIDSTSVSVGTGAAFSAVLGEQLVMILTQAFGIIAPGLPTPPQQSALAAAAGQLQMILSNSVKIAS